MNEVKWQEFKTEIWKQYEMEKFRLNKIIKNERVDPEDKEYIQDGIEKTMTTLLRVMLIMEEFDESVKGIANRELDVLSKGIEGPNEFTYFKQDLVRSGKWNDL